MKRRGLLEADLVADEERDAELDEDHGDELEVDRRNQRLRPLPGAPDVVSRKSDTGSKGYPFLGSARGAKEAGDLFTRRKIVGGQRGWIGRAHV